MTEPIEIVRLKSWKAEVCLRENDTHEITYYATEELARAAIEGEYAAHVAILKARSDVEHKATEETPEYCDSTMKVVWWKKVRDGFVCMKDYFSYDLDVFERSIIGGSAKLTVEKI